MNIAVCIKQTADTESRPTLAPDGSSVAEEGLVWIINPHDESAIEVAVRLRDEQGGTVTLVALGPDRVESALRQGLAMGADFAVHIQCDSMPDDPQIVAGALANTISTRDFDLVLTGEVAIDSAGAQVPQRLGVLLSWPCVTGVEELKVTSNGLTARHPVEQGDEIHRCNLPAIVGINRRIGEPRYPSFRGIMKAKRKPIEKEEAALEVAQLQIASLALPALKSEGKILDYTDGVAEQVIALLREEAKVI
ncbi:MAG: electron transfer flavoprotein subunit beta/FixA family protein [Rhodothermaceae bacterium]|nr:electron transfer flavoprotein subunit beta/FixA family protein [Rhodothermaceae bacterium]MYF41502.1 electron transfer flavoprotein subunit beta/FixA family protein [Rhodothermaceae bacterium]MYH07800.1 electron transfer flavoprotein subunit beta/FixA family protein [Rhodothermaceae bacterium]